MADVLAIKPVKSISGKILLPGSKSMTHRAMLMAALADGPSEIVHPLKSEDTLFTAEALSKLGVSVDWEDDRVVIRPPEVRWTVPEEPLYVGNSGTTMRLLIGFVSAGSGRFILDGSERMRQRPVGPVAEALGQLGVRCIFLNREGYPPVAILSTGLKSGRAKVDASRSSQFLSSLLIAAPCADGPVVVSWYEPVASFPYVRMTLRMMAERGISYKELEKSSIEVAAPQKYASGRFEIEGDCSSASYFWAAAAVTGGKVETFPVFERSYQGDAGFLDVLEMMGCRVTRKGKSVTVEGPEVLKPVDVDMNAMPDMVPTLAVVAAFAEGRTVIRNVGHLKIKESDRLSAVAAELSKAGGDVEILGDDTLVIRGGKKLHGALIRTYGDHRIAMAFSILGLKVDGIVIDNPGVVAKSFPEYWHVFSSVLYGDGV